MLKTNPKSLNFLHRVKIPSNSFFTHNFLQSRYISTFVNIILCFSFESVKKAFVGVGKIIQANDIGDLVQSSVEEHIRATDRH